MHPDRPHDEMRSRTQEAYTPPIEGPTPAQIAEALEALLEGPATEPPAIHAVRALQEAGIDFPLTVGDRRILRLDVARGDPQHGAMRSDDHVSAYSVEHARQCPEEDCYSEVARFEYNAHHHIAGSVRHYCPRCEHVYEEEEWG